MLRRERRTEEEGGGKHSICMILERDKKLRKEKTRLDLTLRSYMCGWREKGDLQSLSLSLSYSMSV